MLTSVEKDCVILENDCMILEKRLHNTRKLLHRRNDYDVEFQSALVYKKQESRYHTAMEWINIGDWMYPPLFYEQM